MASVKAQIQTSFNSPPLHLRNPSMTLWDHLTEDEKRASVDRTCSRGFQGGFAWEAAGRVKDKWEEDIYPNLKTFLNEKHKDLDPMSREMAIYGIACWMVGKEWHLSCPATVFVCGSKEVAKRALKLIEGFLKLGNSGFRAYTHIATISFSCGTSAQGPSREIGLCGALVNVGNSDQVFERQATVGGIVHINGQYYCMTAAHPFLDIDEDCDDTIENGYLTADHIYQKIGLGLLELSDALEPGPNKINVPSGMLIPRKISTSTSPKSPLWAATGTHQTVKVPSNPTLSGLCLGNSGISDVWSLNMESYPGDSGSWVIDPHDDSIVGIIIARCDLNVTYALPARDVFEDIARNLGVIDLTVDEKGSLLTLAMEQGKTDLVEGLLRRAIDLDRGRTAVYEDVLMEASKAGHNKIIQLLSQWVPPGSAPHEHHPA